MRRVLEPTTKFRLVVKQALSQIRIDRVDYFQSLLDKEQKFGTGIAPCCVSLSLFQAERRVEGSVRKSRRLVAFVDILKPYWRACKVSTSRRLKETGCLSK
jgi:hypothetical protein